MVPWINKFQREESTFRQHLKQAVLSCLSVIGTRGMWFFELSIICYSTLISVRYIGLISTQIESRVCVFVSFHLYILMQFVHFQRIGYRCCRFSDLTSLSKTRMESGTKVSQFRFLTSVVSWQKETSLSTTQVSGKNLLPRSSSTAAGLKYLLDTASSDAKIRTPCYGDCNTRRVCCYVFIYRIIYRRHHQKLEKRFTLLRLLITARR